MALAQDPLAEGTNLLRDGRYDDALKVLLPAYASGPTGMLAYTIARCYEGVRDDPGAFRFYTAALQHGGIDAKVRLYCKGRLVAVQKRLKSQPRKSTLSVRATAVGALVLLDGQEIGRTPLSGLLISPGRHTVSVEHEMFDPWKQDFAVEPWQAVHLDARMTDKPTDVLVNTEPAGATARIPGAPECVTPCLVSLRAGSYHLTLERAGYQSVARDFDKPAGQMLELKFALDPVSGQAAGSLRVSVDRSGAEVHIDGRSVGISPLPGPIQLAPGLHRVVARLSGFMDWQADANVGEGLETVVAITMRPAAAVSPGVPVPVPPPIAPIEPIGPRSEPMSGMRKGGWAATSIGIAALLGGGVTTGLAIKNRRDFNTAVRFNIDGDLYISGVTRVQAQDLEAQTKTLAITSGALFGVGVAALTTGLVLLLVEEDRPDPMKAPSLSIAPILTPTAAGATATVTF